ncbi:OmpH family outer membrane protein [Echinicola strongylocentroti]|uniref:OmpH family outer membrane protein n=1 Tax=Echinicola strongylocentroti TaxID=1795355 RepID=A0A2Z4IDR8_9BACT|nr:OmpH family outer membrane protein [Echinicola strongylocentroti]AWW28945.1 OmpH family outer membrane protein [Echinicola strongylocentroti]
MRKFSKALGILGMAAVVLTSCNQGNQSTSTTTGQSSGSTIDMSEVKIAYVNTDSVINNYQFFKDKSEEISEKGKRYEGELANRAQGFEQEVANFQQSAQNMTPNQSRAKQEDLMKKEQNLRTYRNNLMQELSADETNLYNKVYDKIQEFMKGYADENGLEVVLSYTRGGGVWYAHEALDVTEDVTKGLNEAYKAGDTAASTQSKNDSTAVEGE